MSVHAVLSPSASARWLNCAGSVHANAEGSGSSSFYAEEGTAAHALLEMCMRLHNPPDEFEGMVIHRCPNPKGGTLEFVVDQNMIDAVGHAYDYITAWQATHPKGKVLIEHRVHWGAHPKIKLPEAVASGTADVGLVDETPSNLSIELMDYKHGAGKVVEVDDNTQLMLYAVGLLQEEGRSKRFNQITLHITQPRARHADGPVRTMHKTCAELEAWVANVVAPACKKALKHNAPRTAGPWCKWCSAAPTCRALIDHVMEQAGTEFSPVGEQQPPRDPLRLNEMELARAMAAADMIEAWAKAVRGRVLETLMSGREVQGWKLVRGRSTRQWDENKTDEVVRLAHEVFEDPKVYAPRVLLSVAEMETAFKQHAREPKEKVKDAVERFKQTFQPVTTKSVPAVHVAPESDPRPQYTPGSEFDPLI